MYAFWRFLVTINVLIFFLLLRMFEESVEGKTVKIFTITLLCIILNAAFISDLQNALYLRSEEYRQLFRLPSDEVSDISVMVD